MFTKSAGLFILISFCQHLREFDATNVTTEKYIFEKVLFVLEDDYLARPNLTESFNVGYIKSVVGNNSLGLEIFFRAFNRTFEIAAATGFDRLPVVSPLATVGTGNSSSQFRGDFFLGRLLGNSRCRVEGYLTAGLARTTVYCPEDIYDVEPAQQFFEQPDGFNCVVSRHSDVMRQMCDDLPCFKVDTTPKDPTVKAPIQIKAQLNPPFYHQNKVCPIHLVSDHTFRAYHRDNERLIHQQMVSWVSQADAWFSQTDFNGNGEADQLSIRVKKITVLRTDSPGYGKLKDPNLSVDDTLSEMSRWAHPPENGDFCLVVIFVHRDWIKTNGVAYVGEASPHHGGGICSDGQNPVHNVGWARLNTAMMTNVIQGAIRPGPNIAATTTHEIGHSFGSPHDNDEKSYGANPPCARERRAEQNLMNSFSGDMVSQANTMFSPCSIAKMLPVIRNKGRCLSEREEAVCGDGVVQEGEECDCGRELGQCHFVDPCCSGVANHPDWEPCRVARSRGMQCSPASSECCTAHCLVEDRRNVLCIQPDHECAVTSFCDGVSPSCPKPTPAPDGTACRDGSVCRGGSCGHSICSLGSGLQECQCPSPDSCVVCCRSPGHTCVPAFTLGLVSARGDVIRHSAGTPCDHGAFCDPHGRCLRQRSLGTPDRLNTATDESRITKAALFVVNNWYYFLFGIFILILLILMCFGVWKKLTSSALVRDFSEAVNDAKVTYKSAVPEHKLDQVARLSVFFPEAKLEELIEVAAPGKTEADMVSELVEKGYAIKEKNFREKTEPSTNQGEETTV